MSGGSFNYLSSRAPDEIRSIASQIEDMATALDGDGFPAVSARTARLVATLRDAASESDALEALWHMKEWRDSGDCVRSDVRREAVALGEPLPPCQHVERHATYGLRRSPAPRIIGRFMVCEECGDESGFVPEAREAAPG